MPRLFQYHPSISDGDAIGYSIRTLHTLLRQKGCDSFLVCQDSERRISTSEACGLSSLLSATWRSDDILILHHSFFNENLRTLLDIPIRKILVYHNITPGHFFREEGMYELADLTDAGRGQLAEARDAIDLAIGVSEYNSNELREIGYSRCETIPVFYNDDLFGSRVLDYQTYFFLKKQSAVNIVFIGRLVPNKRPDRLIETVAIYKEKFRRELYLHLIGKIWSDDYIAKLMSLAARLRVVSAIRLHISVPPMKLKTILTASDVFLSFSEHEGFMVPLVEAFTVGCPVIAYGAAAIPETMGGAGIKIDVPDPTLAAGLIEALRRDRHTRRKVIIGQASRAMKFRSEVTALRWLAVLEGRFGIKPRAESNAISM